MGTQNTGNKDSPYPPSARRRPPATSTGTPAPQQPASTPAGSGQPGPAKDDPHWAPESGDKPEAEPRR